MIKVRVVETPSVKGFGEDKSGTDLNTLPLTNTVECTNSANHLR